MAGPLVNFNVGGAQVSDLPHDMVLKVWLGGAGPGLVVMADLYSSFGQDRDIIAK